MLPPIGRTEPRASALRQRAALQRERAAWSAGRAERHDALIAQASPQLRESFVRMRDLHRRAQSRHDISAEMHELLASQLDGHRIGQGAEQALMTTVAGRLGASGAAAELRGRTRPAIVVAASDEVARAAHDLELVLAEGPAAEAADGAFVTAAGTGLLERWPRYGPAVAELGIHSVYAAPLRPGGVGLGALCAYEPAAAPKPWTVSATRLMAEALSEMLTGVPGGADAEADLSVF